MAMATALRVMVDLARVRQNAEEIVRKIGPRVDLLATVKADAYGLGAMRISDAIASIVHGWCVFSPVEAQQAQLWERTKKRSIVLGPPVWGEVAKYIEN